MTVDSSPLHDSRIHYPSKCRLWQCACGHLFCAPYSSTRVAAACPSCSAQWYHGFKYGVRLSVKSVGNMIFWLRDQQISSSPLSLNSRIFEYFLYFHTLRAKILTAIIIIVLLIEGLWHLIMVIGKISTCAGQRAPPVGHVCLSAAKAAANQCLDTLVSIS